MTKKQDYTFKIMDTFGYIGLIADDTVQNYLEELSEKGQDEEVARLSYMDTSDVISECGLKLDYDEVEWYFRDDKNIFFNFYDEVKDWFEKRYKTQVYYLLLLSKRSSHYGSIGGNGAQGYKFINDISEIFDVDCDDMVIYVKNGIINIEYHDHDGVDHTELRLVSYGVFDREEELNGTYDVDNNIYDKYKDKGGTKVPLKLIKQFNWGEL